MVLCLIELLYLSSHVAKMTSGLHRKLRKTMCVNAGILCFNINLLFVYTILFNNLVFNCMLIFQQKMITMLETSTSEGNSMTADKVYDAVMGKKIRIHQRNGEWTKTSTI